ncbi:EF-hand domain pair [Polaribacter sp. KT25b]|uniref:EF-hand domain-containing protein n=1 Tax=Polaribacter sp. KT25b TaxID=1855336 RepID=UPI00087BAE31|nr:EF-hand domain-containing protein [Polaribacter sp. KT25b]SDR70280.1 EF-hand domain pair [Polaribacter sp. KT25b]
MKILKVVVIVFTMFIANQVSSQEVSAKTVKKFGRIDSNKDGAIDKEEMKAFYSEKKNKKGSPVEYELMFLGLDSNDDNKISLQELNAKIDWKRAKQKMKKTNK